MPLHQVEIVGKQQFIHYIDNNTQLSFACDIELITIHEVLPKVETIFSF